MWRWSDGETVHNVNWTYRHVAGWQSSCTLHSAQQWRRSHWVLGNHDTVQEGGAWAIGQEWGSSMFFVDPRLPFVLLIDVNKSINQRSCRSTHSFINDSYRSAARSRLQQKSVRAFRENQLVMWNFNKGYCVYYYLQIVCHTSFKSVKFNKKFPWRLRYLDQVLAHIKGRLVAWNPLGISRKSNFKTSRDWDTGMVLSIHPTWRSH